MPVERATHAYRTRRANCAQSVMLGFQDHLDVPDHAVHAASAHGAGRVSGGLCGALHAALGLTPTPEAAARIREKFVRAAGSEVCREIRKAGVLPCEGCVRTAAALLAEELGMTDKGAAPSEGVHAHDA